MNHLFIVNPHAGKGGGLKLIPKIEEIFSGRKDGFTIEVTKYPGHATEIAAEYARKGFDRIYSVGGDGTLGEVLRGMVGSGTSLGAIPAGSGNDFIRSLICDPATNIIQRTVDGSEKAIDIGKVNGKHFINISSMGFDAHVTFIANKIKSLSSALGGVSYATGILGGLLKFNNSILKISIDETKFTKKSLMIIISNGKYYGGGMKPTPEAQVDDGLFDICLVEAKNIFEIPFLFPKFIKGEHASIRGVHFYKGKRVEVSSEREIAINIDGEAMKVTNAVFEIVPKGVKIIIPKEH